jgi:hypothetical protein
LVAGSSDAVFSAIDALEDDPNEYRNELYEQNRVRLGLPGTDS